jgi:hypothetical protein
MTDFTQILDRLPPQVTNVIRQLDTGDDANVSDADARDAFDHVTTQLTPEEFQKAAADAYNRLTPEQRSEAAEYLRKQAQERGIQVPNLPTGDIAATDSGALADATAQVNQDGNILQDMFAPGGTFSSPIAKAVLLGITAVAAQQLSKRM